MEHDEQKEEADPKTIHSQPSPAESSRSDVSEVVLWTHSESSSESSDETAKSMLDFRSPRFSPTLALKCRTDDVSVADGAKKYLNLQQYSKAVQSPSKSPRKDVAPIRKRTLEDLNKRKNNTDALPIPSSSLSLSSSVDPTNYPIPGRRFLPHQLPVYRPRKEHPNTITLMDSVEGPLSVLRRVMAEKTRIKIWTRNEKGFRGLLTGFVEAFDKHWNLALRDVDEQFVRKKVIKFPVFDDSISENNVTKITTSQKQNESGTSETKKSGNTNDNEDETMEQAISASFIRLKNYLRQNDGMTRKRMGTRTASPSTTSTSIQANKIRRSPRKASSSKETTTINSPTKSKTVYVGDMDPLSICRAGLANLSLRDGIHQHQLTKKQKTSFSSAVTPKSSSRKSSRNKMTTRSDIAQCHQSSSGIGERSSSFPSAATSSVSTCSTLQHQQHPPPDIISRTSLKKKSLTIFKTPCEDSFGFMVVAQTRKYELVERHVGQVLLMGNDIVFIETGSGC